MDIRQAILKAADWIELHPEEFDFRETEVPACGTPGCALGWIGTFAGCERGSSIDMPPGSPTKLLGLNSQLRFYERMDAFFGGGAYANTESRWRHNPMQCARGLRLYADKYHPATVDESSTPLDPAFLAFRDTLKPLASALI